jgi:hypothetical protein
LYIFYTQNIIKTIYNDNNLLYTEFIKTR